LSYPTPKLEMVNSPRTELVGSHEIVAPSSTLPKDVFLYSPLG